MIDGSVITCKVVQTVSHCIPGNFSMNGIGYSDLSVLSYIVNWSCFVNRAQNIAVHSFYPALYGIGIIHALHFLVTQLGSGKGSVIIVKIFGVLLPAFDSSQV